VVYTVRVFGRVVVVAFQSAFYSKKYANNIFYFLKIIFEISTSK
jgi:hypothetical protein